MANETTPKPVAKGETVHLVHANGKHLPAKVANVRKGGKLIDLEVDLGGDEPTVITSSPLDLSGKQPDSWHPVEAEPKEEAKGEAPKS